MISLLDMTNTESNKDSCSTSMGSDKGDRSINWTARFSSKNDYQQLLDTLPLKKRKVLSNNSVGDESLDTVASVFGTKHLQKDEGSEE